MASASAAASSDGSNFGAFTEASLGRAEAKVGPARYDHGQICSLVLIKPFLSEFGLNLMSTPASASRMAKLK